jgi:hypothetical protein
MTNQNRRFHDGFKVVKKQSNLSRSKPVIINTTLSSQIVSSSLEVLQPVVTSIPVTAVISGSVVSSSLQTHPNPSQEGLLEEVTFPPLERGLGGVLAVEVPITIQERLKQKMKKPQQPKSEQPKFFPKVGSVRQKTPIKPEGLFQKMGRLLGR